MINLALIKIGVKMQRIVCFIICSFLFVPSLLAQNQAKSIPKEYQINDSSIYIEERKKIDALIEKGESPITLVDKYRKEAIANPKMPKVFLEWKKDPVIIYRWAYALFRLDFYAREKRTGENEGKYPDYYMVRTLVEGPNMPKCREWTRVIYLIWPQRRESEAMGDKLVSYDSTDWEVRYWMCRKTIGIVDIATEKKCLKYLNELIYLQPNNRRSYLAGGTMYGLKWQWTVPASKKNPEDLKKVIYYDKLALKYTDKGSDTYKGIISSIETCKKELLKVGIKVD
jgi:hypothetical protein